MILEIYYAKVALSVDLSVTYTLNVLSKNIMLTLSLTFRTLALRSIVTLTSLTLVCLQ